MGRRRKRKGRGQRAKTVLPPPVAVPTDDASAPRLAVLAASVPAPVTTAAETTAELVGEHRETQRVSLSVELHLASESHFFSGLSGNISEGGVFVSTYRALARGSLVEIDFSLPGSTRTVRARGEVRWHRDGSPDASPGVGIAFEDLSEEDRLAIQRFCSVRPPLYYEDVG